MEYYFIIGNELQKHRSTNYRHMVLFSENIIVHRIRLNYRTKKIPISTKKSTVHIMDTKHIPGNILSEK